MSVQSDAERKPLAELNVSCRECLASMSVLLHDFGRVFKAYVVNHCPRCGSRNIAVEQKWDDDNAAH
ncbi:MAG TPA: hypothetical protein VJ891_10075 [Casimicrobiaceae bacterium]|nr:hypothetical protein [Casimicrobiaceae bacterium]